MKLKRIKHMKCEDIATLATFANIDLDNLQYPQEEDNYKYKELLHICHRKENINNEINVEQVIDKLMFDNYDIYVKIKQRLNDSSDIFNDGLDYEDEQLKNTLLESKKYIEKYIKLYEKLMFEIKFEYADIRSVQRYLLQERMQSEIRKENYEICNVLKKKIEEV